MFPNGPNCPLEKIQSISRRFIFRKLYIVRINSIVYVLVGNRKNSRWSTDETEMKQISNMGQIVMQLFLNKH